MPRFPRRKLLCILALPVVFQAAPARGAAPDGWLRFRGPGGRSISDETGLPVTWSPTENVVWKRELPGFGASSPVVAAGKVFLTCYSGYGTEAADKAATVEDLVRHVVCLRRSDGEPRWQRDVPAVQPEADFTSFLRVHGYTASTPVCDGERLYVFFGKSGVLAYDLDGELLWRAEVGSGFSGWGSGASPVLHGDLLYVNASIERQSLYALNKHTGEEVWRVKRMTSSWSTPVVAELPGGGEELVVNVHRRILGLDPATGEELWSCGKRDDESYSAPSPVARDGKVYLFDGDALLAIRAGGRGDVTDSHILWRADNVGSGITSPTLAGDYVYAAGDRGIVSCVAADSGKVLYKERLGSSRIFASPLVADGKVYIVSREDGAYVLPAGPDFKILAHNRLDPTVFNATPAVHHSQLLLRSNRALYCLDETK